MEQDGSHVSSLGYFEDRCSPVMFHDSPPPRAATSKSAVGPLKPLAAMVRAIELDDLDRLRELLEEHAGLDISDPLVRANLPKHWHHVVRTVLSTPLRTAISWRNQDAMRMILCSRCRVSVEDKNGGLMKILRQIRCQTDVEILKLLVNHEGANTYNPAHFSLSFRKTLSLDDGLELSESVVDACCAPCVPNSLKGHMLLSVVLQLRDDQAETMGGAWGQLVNYTRRAVMCTDFSPTLFLQDDVWLQLGSPAFRRLVLALPLLIQTSKRTSVVVMGTILRLSSRNFPMLCEDARAALQILPRLLQGAGYPLRWLVDAACLSPRFIHTTGFSRLLRQPAAPSLSGCCRVTIREAVSLGNLYTAVGSLQCLPTRLRQYLLMVDITPLSFEPNIFTVE